MLLPKLNEIKQKTIIQNEFRGLDTNIFPDKYGFTEMKNLTYEDYPVFSSRKKRGFIKKLTKPNGIFSKNGLVYADGENLYHNGNFIANINDGKKQFVSFSEKLIIFPDKIMVDFNTGEVENLEASFTSIGEVSVCFSDITGKQYENVAISGIQPQGAKNGDFWLDTSSVPHKLKVYSEYLEAFSDIETTYLKISSAGIGSLFSQFEGVKIKGLIKNELNGDYVISAADENFIVIPAITDEIFSQNESIEIIRKVPDMDYICVFGGRLWGCSKLNNEIYASRLSDPKSFYSFSGLSTDSYALKLSSDGEFTSCGVLDNSVVFFKENSIHRIYGTKPSNFTLSDYIMPGVEEGSEKSVCNINGNLYYKAPLGFYVFDGASSYKISKAIDNLNLKNAIGAELFGNYFVSCEENGKRELFTFSENTSLWYKQDEIDIEYMVSAKNEIYALLKDGWIVSLFGNLSLYEGEEAFEESYLEDDVGFYAVTPDLNYHLAEFTYLTKIAIKARMGKGAILKAAVSYDNEELIDVLCIQSENEQAVSIPLNLKRARSVRLALYGKGDVKITSLIKYSESGGDF